MKRRQNKNPLKSVSRPNWGQTDEGSRWKEIKGEIVDIGYTDEMYEYIKLPLSWYEPSEFTEERTTDDKLINAAIANIGIRDSVSNFLGGEMSKLFEALQEMGDSPRLNERRDYVRNMIKLLEYGIGKMTGVGNKENLQLMQAILEAQRLKHPLIKGIETEEKEQPISINVITIEDGNKKGAEGSGKELRPTQDEGNS